MFAYVVGKAREHFVVEGDVELDGRDARTAVLEDWARDFSTRINGRDIVHMQLSAPPGSDRVQLLAAARAFAAETFGATHQYALAEHRDTAHPHCHLLLKLKGHDGRMLDPRKAMLAQWREAFAKAARAQGLMLDASPRIARGASRRSRTRARIELDRRSGLVEAAATPPRRLAPDAAARLRHRLQLERDAFHHAALRIARHGERDDDPDERRRYRSMARELIEFGDRLAPEASPKQENPRGRRTASASKQELERD